MDINALIREVKSYNPDTDEALIRRAYAYAAEKHDGQKRNSGEPYIIHPLNTAYILAQLKMDDATICAGLAHDVLEDTPVTKEEMEKEFGKEITDIVDGVTKLKKIETKSKFENQADNYRKMVVAMANDIRVIIVKLADRLHNLRTLDYKTPEKQVEKARETIEIYVPIADRLGIAALKAELEDLCLKYLEPEAYYGIAELLNKNIEERKEDIHRIEEILAKRLDLLSIHYTITGRPKSIYSIYKKMYLQDKTFDQIFDVMGIRVLVDSVSDCYSVLGIVHTLWKPIPKRFKDYIAVPKPNMYQSLQTTVIGDRGETFEVQIRTWEMHKTAEYGIAAHWQYKEDKKKQDKFDQKLTWVRQLMEWQKTATDSKEFLDTLKGDYFSDEVYVFSPKGDVVELPAGSTPIDFAYHVHTDVGNKCVGAKIDGRLVPLSTKLQNGNIVEVLTSQNSVGPSRDWLDFVQSSSVKTKIRQFFKHADREENILLGKEMLIQNLNKDNFKPNELMTEEAIQEVAEKMHFSSADDLYAAVGFGSKSVSSINTKLKEIYRNKQTAERISHDFQPENFKENPFPIQDGDTKVRVKDTNLMNLQFKFAQCCSPVPGDEIVGYITRGHGISVHRKDCVNMINVRDKERLISVEWNKTKDAKFYAAVKIEALNRTGYLADLAQLISKMGINMIGVDAKPTRDQLAHIKLTVEIQDLNEVEELMKKIRSMDNTLSVYRLKM